jgi:hypothetical protein
MKGVEVTSSILPSCLVADTREYILALPAGYPVTFGMFGTMVCGSLYMETPYGVTTGTDAGCDYANPTGPTGYMTLGYTAPVADVQAGTVPIAFVHVKVYALGASGSGTYTLRVR